jgi:hypothetical protein
MPRLTLLIWLLRTALCCIGIASAAAVIPVQSVVASSNGDISQCALNTGCGTTLLLVLDTGEGNEASAMHIERTLMAGPKLKSRQMVASAVPLPDECEIRAVMKHSEAEKATKLSSITSLTADRLDESTCNVA